MARPLTNALQNFMMSKQARQQEVAQQQQQQRAQQTREGLGQMIMGGDPGNLAQVNPEAFIMGQNYLQQQESQQQAAKQQGLVSELRQQYAQTQDPDVLRQLMAVDPEASAQMQKQMGIVGEEGRNQAINQATAFSQVIKNSPDEAMQYYRENLADNPAFQGIEDELQAGDYEGALKGIEVGITALGGQEAYEKYKGIGTGPDVGTYNPRDYTVESFAEFTKTKDPSVLERYSPQRTAEIGGVPHVFDPVSGEWKPAKVTGDAAQPEGRAVTAETVAESEAEIAATRETAVQEARSQVEKTQGRDMAIERTQEQITTFDNTIDRIDTSIDQADDFGSTGFMSNILGSVPGTPAYDLKQNVLTIKANIGFDRLQRMRELSPTGGALGNVANQELDALQATIASLDTAQSKDQLIENLKRVKKHYNNWKKNQQKYLDELQSGDGEEAGKPGKSKPAMDPDAAEDFINSVLNPGGQ